MEIKGPVFDEKKTLPTVEQRCEYSPLGEFAVLVAQINGIMHYTCSI